MLEEKKGVKYGEKGRIVHPVLVKQKNKQSCHSNKHVQQQFAAGRDSEISRRNNKAFYDEVHSKWMGTHLLGRGSGAGQRWPHV